MSTTLRQMIPRIFISHSNDDDEFCLKLIDDLQRVLGITTPIWFASLALVGGQKWKDEITKELAECDIFIVILSPKALASDWVNVEMNMAFQRKKRWEKIIPVHYRKCNQYQLRLRPELLENQIVSLLPPTSYEEGFKNLLAALLSIEIESQPPIPVDRRQPLRFSRRDILEALIGLVVGGGSVPLLSHLFGSTPQHTTQGPTPPLSSTPCLPAVRPYNQSHTYYDHKGEVDTVAWSPNGALIASGSRDNTVQIWDPGSGKNLNTYTGHTLPVYGVAWSPDSKYIASGSVDTTVQVWTALTGQLLFTYSGHKGAVHGVAWSPDGKKIASASDDGTVKVYNAVTGDQLYSYGGHTAAVWAVAWSPDSKRIASGSWDTTVQVWDAASGSRFMTYIGHFNYVVGLAWSPDGKHIVSGAWDHTAQVWDAASGNRKFIYRGHQDILQAVAWSPDGKGSLPQVLIVRHRYGIAPQGNSSSL
jgi:WD40 repeat protein